MPKFQEFEISDFRGIATSNRHPQKNECQECKNFDTRYVDGDLTLRAGFLQKYPAIANADHRTKLSNITYLDFENFYVPNDGGQEITIWVSKAMLEGETEIANSKPASRGILTLFSSHQFVNNAWDNKNWDKITDGKYWLNHTILTTMSGTSTDNEVVLDCNGTSTLTGSIDTTASVNVVGDGTLFTTELVVGDRILVGTELRTVATIIDNTHLTVTAAFTDQADDTSPQKFLNLDGWTIINITKSPYEVAQVIETYDAGSGQLGVKITNNAHSWSDAIPDEIVLMKNYIPYDNLIAMYSCTANDITFHKVLNDLRIGFGGYKDRIGLSVGYRKSYVQLGAIDFGSYSSFYEALATTNNLIVTTYTETNEINTFITITTAVGSIPAGKYFFRLTALLDDFNEVLISQTSITLTIDSDIIPNIRINPGSSNKRITKFKLYVASINATTDLEPTNPYYFLKEYILRRSTFTNTGWSINNDGYMQLTDGAEINTVVNATINSVTDDNNANGWSNSSGMTRSVEDAFSETLLPQLGDYFLKYTNGAAIKDFAEYIQPKYPTIFYFIPGISYLIEFDAAVSNAAMDLRLSIGVSGEEHIVPFTSANTWESKSVVIVPVSTARWILFKIIDMPASASLRIDALSIKPTVLSSFSSLEPLTTGSEMSDSMGYQPTFDMIKSWDQAVITSGRTFYVNPYIDKRWENKIFRSHISGAGAFMYDVASAESYIDVEAFDNNDLIGIEVLPNLQFLALNRNGAQRIDPDTGAARQVDKGKGCVARKSIVNFGDKVVWCGEHDIYMSDGLDIISIADKTIREEYRALTTKSSIIATMEAKDNAYRFFTGNTSLRTEYILTKKGWIKRVNGGSIYPSAFSPAINGTNDFMVTTGAIYNENDADTTVLDESLGLATAVWQSIDIDSELIGESISERDFIYIASMWIDYTLNYAALDPPSLNFSIYLDGTLAKTKSFIMEPNTRYKQFVKLPLGSNCRRFSLYVSVTGNDTTSFVYGKHLSIHSAGVMMKTIKTGFHN